MNHVSEGNPGVSPAEQRTPPAIAATRRSLLSRLKPDLLSKIWEAIWARWSLRNCTKVGRLTRVTGRVVVNNQGSIQLGDRVKIRANHVPVEIATGYSGVLTIGDNVFINSGVSICALESVTIGNNCAIGNYTLIMDSDFHTVGDIDALPEARPVTIEDDVWLAARVTVLKGIRIGRGAVVAAGAVVTRDVPPYTVVAGVPARVLRSLPVPDPSGKETR